MKFTRIILLLPLLALATAGRADDFAARVADRVAIERVYHEHRLGTKPPFEQALPPALIEQLVRLDMHKEAVLSKVYGMEITPAIIAAEVQRITSTTRAPEVLAEIRHAVGDDTARFALAMARPMIVETELRRRFDTDTQLHAGRRHEAEQARASLLARQPVEGLHDVTWQLTPRPASEASTSQLAKASSRAYSVEATVQLAQVIAAPDNAAPGKEKVYFEDLDAELQTVLLVQLQKPGDVSAVIEMPSGFLVFLARDKNSQTLSAAALSIAKRSYEEWLAGQPEEKP